MTIDFSDKKQFDAWVDENIVEEFKHTVVPANYYKHVRYGREFFHGSDEEHKDPYRPVVMQGAKASLVARHALSKATDCANGYCREVIRRWVSRTKFTCTDSFKCWKIIDGLLDHVAEGLYTTRHLNGLVIFPCTFKNGVPIKDGHPLRYW